MNHRTQNHSVVQVTATPHLFHGNITADGIQMVHSVKHLYVDEHIDEADLADRLVEIQRDDRLRLTLQEWESTQKRALVTVQCRRARCFATKNELYQLVGFYTVFQGVVFSAVAMGSLLQCQTCWGPSSLSLLVSVATIPAVHDRLKDYCALKNSVLGAIEESEVMAEKIKTLKRKGANFDFVKLLTATKSESSRCEERRRCKLVQSRRNLVVRWLTTLFLCVFSSIILSCCYIIPCWEFIDRSALGTP